MRSTQVRWWPAEEAADPGAPAGDDELPPLPREAGRRRLSRWLPESTGSVRADAGRRGLLVLALVAALGAVAAALGVWFQRPREVPVAPGPAVTVAAVPVDPAEPTGAASSPRVVQATEPAPPTEIVVSVTGRVRTAGLVQLPAGARVADAIDAAGGALDEADLTGLNLAAVLADGDSVVIGPAGAGESGHTPQEPSTAPTSAGLVDLNLGSEAEFEELPGVGPVTAAGIVEWRTRHGPFTSVDQLQEVPGIGPARFARLVGLVTVGR